MKKSSNVFPYSFSQQHLGEVSLGWILVFQRLSQCLLLTQSEQWMTAGYAEVQSAERAPQNLANASLVKKE